MHVQVNLTYIHRRFAFKEKNHGSGALANVEGIRSRT